MTELESVFDNPGVRVESDALVRGDGVLAERFDDDESLNVALDPQNLGFDQVYGLRRVRVLVWQESVITLSCRKA